MCAHSVAIPNANKNHKRATTFCSSLLWLTVWRWEESLSFFCFLFNAFQFGPGFFFGRFYFLFSFIFVSKCHVVGSIVSTRFKENNTNKQRAAAATAATTAKTTNGRLIATVNGSFLSSFHSSISLFCYILIIAYGTCVPQIALTGRHHLCLPSICYKYYDQGINRMGVYTPNIIISYAHFARRSSTHSLTPHTCLTHQTLAVREKN